MKLFRRPITPAMTTGARNDAQAVIAGQHATDRVCGTNCNMACPSCGSTACQCRCRPECEMAPRALSSEPESFPVEEHIVPLVYELKRLGAFTPCWSCEGHDDNAGKLRRAPGVWFYCDSVVQVRLLAQGIEQLGFRKELSTPWRVGISVAEPDNPDTLYQLEPAIQDLSAITLVQLRADIRVIAHHLNHFVLDAASAMAEQTL